MRPGLKICGWLIFLLAGTPAWQTARANTLTVVSNADDGTGTLRDAMRIAAANGTQITDTIRFQLPDISENGRTIQLLSSLPPLSSNLVIDGSTQPGAVFGNSGAKVLLLNLDVNPGYTCFTMQNIRQVEIYGLYIKGQLGASFYALHMRQIQQLRFGAPGKGNLVQGFGQAIFNEYFAGESPSDSLYFQSNFLGTDANGDTLSGSTINHQHFSLTHVRNVAIGGTSLSEGNVVAGGTGAITITYWDTLGGFLHIRNNRINTDRTGMKQLITYLQSDIMISGWNDGSSYPEGTTDVAIIFRDNILSARLELFKIRYPFLIAGNHFGVAADHVTRLQELYQCLLMLKFCAAGTVGGNTPADRNYFAYADGAGVCEFHSGNITITRNSFFCHTQPGIQFWAWDFARPVPAVTVNTIGNATVTGTATPLSRVEIFEDDDCPGCQGKTYLGSTLADAAGYWQYTGAFGGNLVATATDTFGATSPFSVATIDAAAVQLKDATCGNANGYIKNIRIISGSRWQWEDAAGNIVGTDSNLLNLLPGRYRLVVTNGSSSCQAVSAWFEIKGIPPPAPFDAEGGGLLINHPTCGLFNGTMTYLRPFNDSLLYRWLTPSGVVMCQDFTTTNPATGFPPGDYYIELRLKADSSCAVRNGPYPMVNFQGPQLNTNQPVIQHASCGRSNGSITGISLQNATGPVTYYWLDSTGSLLVNTADLLNVPPGRYQLRCKDQTSCDTIITPYYVVNDLGKITVDSSTILIQPAPCTGQGGGSVNGLSVSGASRYDWFSQQTGALVGNALNLVNVPPGTYRLEMSNVEGCTKTAGPFSVPAAGFQPLSADSIYRQDASCDLNNGQLRAIRFSVNPPLHQLRWLNSNGSEAGRGAAIGGLPAGTYRLEATDINGCREVIVTETIAQLGPPVFDYSRLQIIPDTCALNTGALLNLNAAGGLSPLVWEWEAPAGVEIPTGDGNLYLFPAGQYRAKVTDAQGCIRFSNPLTIPAETQVLPAPRVPDVQVPRNTSATLQVQQPVNGIYEWRTDASSGNDLLARDATGVFATAPLEENTRFSVQLQQGNCTSTATLVEVKVIDATQLFIPGAFSPNNDGLNDLWRVRIQGMVTRFSIIVYNRWGEPVYQSEDPNAGWDGRLRGKLLDPGNYTYTIRAVDIRNYIIEKKGSLLLIR